MKRACTIAALALIGGVMGGVISTRILSPRLGVAADENGEGRQAVTATEIIIVDDQGNARARLGKNSDGLIGLELYDADGLPRGLLGTTDKGASYLYFYGKKRSESLRLAAGAQGGSGLELWDEQGHRRVRLESSLPSTMGGVSKGGLTVLELSEDTGLGLELTALGNIGSSIRFFDNKRDQRASAWLGVSRLRGVFLEGCDTNQKPRVSLGISKENESFLRLYDKDSQVSFEAP